MLPSPTSDDLPDNELALLARTDPRSFTLLFDRFFKRIYRYFAFRLRDDAEAEDLTSETFLKLSLHIRDFEERGVPFSAWLFRIAHNTLIDSFRKKRIQTTSLEDLDPGDEPSVPFATEDLDRELLRRELWDAMQTLPQKYQDLWGLKLSTSLTHREIAELLETTENNVNVMVHRSIALLKRQMTIRRSHPRPSTP